MDPILGMIILWSGNFTPVGWLLCDGSIVNVNQYQALYSILGQTYGGNGSTTFAVPDLRGRAAISTGQGAGLSAYILGQKGGVESITLTQAQIPVHTHTATGTLAGSATGTLPALSGTGSLPASASLGSSDSPGPALFPAKAPDYLSQGLTQDLIYGASDGTTKMPVTVAIPSGTNMALSLSSGTAAVTVANTGGGGSHDNRQPFLALSYLIATDGIYPQRP